MEPCRCGMHPGAVADWHRDITEANGPVVANKCCKVLRAAYKRSAKRDVSLPQRDPCSAVEYNTETPAQKAMAFRDFPKWLKAWRVIEVGPKAPARKEYHLFGLFTGMRPGEIARIRWRDVKPAHRVVEIPGAKAGNTIGNCHERADRPRTQTSAHGTWASRRIWMRSCLPTAAGRTPRRATPRGHDLRHSLQNLMCRHRRRGGPGTVRVLPGWKPKNTDEKYIT